MRALVKAMLVALGMKSVRDYANGEQALEAIEKFTPDLIITDWMMAPVDDLEFAKFIRSDIDSRDIFALIILMTGRAEKWRIITARDPGVNEFLAKPISAKTLCDRILAVIEKPKPCVRTMCFFGLWRRRVNWKEYVGSERRFKAERTNELMNFDVDSIEQAVADVERLSESL